MSGARLKARPLPSTLIIKRLFRKVVSEVTGVLLTLGTISGDGLGSTRWARSLPAAVTLYRWGLISYRAQLEWLQEWMMLHYMGIRSINETNTDYRWSLLSPSDTWYMGWWGYSVACSCLCKVTLNDVLDECTQPWAFPSNRRWI